MKRTIIMTVAFLALTLTFATAKTRKVKKQTTTQVNADTLNIDTLKKKAEAGDSNAQNTLGICYYTGRKVEKNYETALKWWSVAAKASHVEAIANMGLCYQMGNGTKRDSVMAVKLYKESIKKGNKALVAERENRLKEKVNLFDACFLAEIFEEGTVVEKDINKAVKYHLMAGNAGSMPSLVAAAKIYEKDKNYPQAFKLYSKAASTEVEAAYKCGEYLYKGLGTAVNKAEAAKYLKVAAKSRIPKAQIMLGNLYYKGEGVKQDVAQALALYKQAALPNNPVAMWDIGLIYIDGAEGVSSNFQKGLYWMALASNMGMKTNFQKKINDVNSGENSGWKNTDFHVYVEGMKHLYGYDKNVEEAVKCFEKLEKNGMTAAITMKALCYADKDWKKCNVKKAVKLLQKAVEKNEPAACYEMALRYETGDGVEADKKKAVELIQKAAEKGHAKAICHLGKYYNEGWGVEKNITKAIAQYQSAMLEGYLSPEAAKVLSECYKQGIGGLKKNQKMAEAVLKKAVKVDPVKILVKDLKLE
ncbi:MAG: sel1 repeat family protein [Bacteroidales bacterium]|nr:sel1 repeat family protein [Bacteroidales bacterium]